MSHATERRHGLMRGVMWVGVGRFLARCIGLVSTLVLARLLVPSDFGIVAVAQSTVSLLLSFTAMGFGLALIQFREASDADFATAWTMGFIRGLVLCLIVLALAAPVARWMDDPRLFPLFLVLSLVPLLEGIRNPRIVAYEKDMRFDVFFRLALGTKITGVTVAIVTAVLTRSYWALVAGMIANNTMRTVLTYVFAPLPGRPTLASWRKLMGFSGWLSGSEMLRALSERTEAILIGSLSTPAVVGYYHMSKELTVHTVDEVILPLRRVLFPAMSRFEADSPERTAAYRQSVAGVAMIVAPLGIGVSLVAPVAVPLVLGDQWLAAIPAIQVLALSFVAALPGRMSDSAVMAAGATRVMFYRNLVLTPVKLIAFFVLVRAYGLIGAAWGAMVAALVSTAIGVVLGARFGGIGIGAHFTCAWRSWVSAAVMSAVVLGIGAALTHSVDPGPWGRLFVMVLTGAGVYTVLHAWLWSLCGRPDTPENALFVRVRPVLKRLRLAPSFV